MSYARDLLTILQTAGWMLAIFAAPLGLWAIFCAAIKSVSPDRITSRAQKGRNL